MDKVFTIERNQMLVSLNGDPANPPVLLIHGWGSHRGVWRQTIAALQTRYYCVAPDLLGFGASDKPANADYSVLAQGQRILKLADQLELSTFSIIGHSFGGQIALYIAATQAPRRVDKLVSVAGVITGRLSDRVEKLIVPFVSLARRFPGLYGLARAWLNIPGIAGWEFGHWFYDMNSIPFEAWEADRNAALNPASAIALDETAKAIHALNMSKYVHKVKAPVLLISGEDDDTVPVDQATLAQAGISNNQLAIIKKCGHFPMYEKTSQYLRALALIFPN